jgi:hypothetical protein
LINWLNRQKPLSKVGLFLGVCPIACCTCSLLGSLPRLLLVDSEISRPASTPQHPLEIED